MPDYSKAKIYTICYRNDDSLIYVGSTVQSLAKRWGNHKCDSLVCPNMPLYQNVNNDWSNWYIELYQNFPCNSKEELHKKEGEIIREIGTLNKRIAGRKKHEYRLDNADKLVEYKKQYSINNAEKIDKNNKQYRIDNASKIKQYFICNAEKLAEPQKQYYADNAEKIAQKIEQQFKCECGSCCRIGDKARHFKTKKHINFLEKNKIIS